jgi:hypothetical protein
MSRSATVSTSKNPPHLPSKSAWARGPSQKTSTPSGSQFPAPPTPVSVTNPANFHATLSRRSSALGQGVSIKDGVGIPRNAVKQGMSVDLCSRLLPQLVVLPGSAVTFGSIDAPVSSLSAPAPPVNAAYGVKSFGSIAVQNGASDAAQSAVTSNRPPPLSSVSSASAPSSVPQFDKKSIAKLFQGPSTQSVAQSAVTNRPLPLSSVSSASAPSVPKFDKKSIAKLFQGPSTGSDDEAAEEGDTLAPAAMSEGEAKSKIDEDVKEFFGVRLLDEAELYFSSLPIEHRHHLVETLVMKSIEMKEPDVRLVGDLFVRVREKHLCSPAAFEEGFLSLADLLDDLPIIIPKAWLYFAILLKGSGLDQDEERYARIAEKTVDPDRLNRLL